MPALATSSANPFLPFSASITQLQSQLSSRGLSTSHALVDLHRLLSDLLITAASTFLYTPLPSPSSALTSLTISPDPAAAATTSLLRLRDACLLSVSTNRVVEDVRRLSQWSAASASRSVTEERCAQCVLGVAAWLEELSAGWEEGTAHAADASLLFSPARTATAAGGSVALSIIASSSSAECGQLPASWTEAEFRLHCQPLWNTGVLDLAKAEEEETERETAAEEERKEKQTAYREREKEKKEKQRQKQQRERERDTQQREAAADRAKRLQAGDIDEDEAAKEVEEEKAARAAEAETEETEEKEEEIVVPPEVQRHTPLAFCCVVCHQTLLSPAHIHRVQGNTVWSKKGLKLDALIRNVGELWEQLSAEEDRGADADDEEAEAAAADKADDEGAATATARPVQTAAAYCSRCFHYMGRWLVKAEQFRLVHIDRLTGRNWMYITGELPGLASRLTPLVLKKEGEAEEEEEAAAEEEEAAEDGDDGEKAKAEKQKAEEVPAVVGLPFSYVSVAQAVLYPFPRFPLTAIAATPALPNGNFPVLSSEVITALLGSAPDPLYSVVPSSLWLLQRVDASFTARLLLSIVSQHLLTLFASFAAPTPTSPYHPPSASPVPPFTHFYLSPPELTHARGTARYAFHYLTGKDDSKCKRLPFSLPRLRQSAARHPMAVVMLMAGGWGGMRVVAVKLGRDWRLFQSNDRVKGREGRYTLPQWLREGGRWSRVLAEEEADEWWGKLERARRGEQAVWEEIFCRGQPVRSSDAAPQDRFKDSECQYTVAKLLPDLLME